MSTDRIPYDEGLPQLRRLLDPDAMAPILARSLQPGTALGGVRILYLRYKPGTRLIVRYGVTLDGGTHDATVLAEPAVDLAAWTAAPAHVALARKVNGRAPARTPLSYEPEVDALIQWLPLDITMPALAQDPDELRVLLRAEGVELPASAEGTHLLAYKARRRAVLRLDEHVVKIYAGEADFENAVVGLRGSGRLSGLLAPRAEAVLAPLALTCQTLLGGKPPEDPGDAARAAGSALAVLHDARFEGLRPFPPARQLAAAAASARSAAAVVPELEDRLAALVRELELATPEVARLVPTHGDFHANQVLEVDGALAVIDFDEVCAAPGALDFSSYVAHLVNGGPGDLDAAARALDDLVAGYGRRPPGLAWYVSTSIVRRAPFPFRFMDEDWPARIERMVADAEEAISL